MGLIQTFPIGLGRPPLSGVYASGGAAFDVAIAGCPFRVAASDQWPMERGLSQVRKQQIDQSDVPGDQSLNSWWLRSQTDWSAGAGQPYLEPATDARVMRKFKDARNVDVWNPGQVTLLPYLEKLAAAPAAYVFGSVDGSVHYALGTGGGYRFTIASDRTVSTASLTGLPLGTVAGVTVAGGAVWAGCLNGGSYEVYRATAGGTAFSSWWTGFGSSPVRVWSAKSRLILTAGNQLFVKAFSDASGAIGSPLYTHPSASWTWTGVCDAPSAVLACGYDTVTGESMVVRFTLDTSGALPSLSGGAITTAEMPRGEWITSMISYLGAYLILGTSHGVRVGTINTESEVTYGPWTFEMQAGGPAITHLAPWSRFVYFLGTTRRVVRLDLSELDEQGRAAWAWDQGPVDANHEFYPYMHVSGDRTLTLIGTDLVLGSKHLYHSSAELHREGWLETGLVRFGTLEPKTFHSIRLESAEPIYGTIAVESVAASGTRATIASIAPGAQTGIAFNSGIENRAITALGLRFNFYRDDDTTKGPVLESWTLRALPATDRQELLRVPLLCFDFERDSRGVRDGYEGAALARYAQLRDLVRSGTPVAFQDLNTGEELSVVVEDLSFQQIAPPSKASGSGGIVYVTVRTV